MLKGWTQQWVRTLRSERSPYRSFPTVGGGEAPLLPALIWSLALVLLLYSFEEALRPKNQLGSDPKSVRLRPKLGSDPRSVRLSVYSHLKGVPPHTNLTLNLHLHCFPWWPCLPGLTQA